MPYFLPVGPSVCKQCQQRAKTFIMHDCRTCGCNLMNQFSSSASSFHVKMTGQNSTFSSIIPLFIHILWLCLQQYFLNAKLSPVSFNTTTFLRVSPEEFLCIDTESSGLNHYPSEIIFFPGHLTHLKGEIEKRKEPSLVLYSTFQAKGTHKHLAAE